MCYALGTSHVGLFGDGADLRGLAFDLRSDATGTHQEVITSLRAEPPPNFDPVLWRQDPAELADPSAVTWRDGLGFADVPPDRAVIRASLAGDPGDATDVLLLRRGRAATARLGHAIGPNARVVAGQPRRAAPGRAVVGHARADGVRRATTLSADGRVDELRDGGVVRRKTLARLALPAGERGVGAVLDGARGLVVVTSHAAEGSISQPLPRMFSWLFESRARFYRATLPGRSRQRRRRADAALARRRGRGQRTRSARLLGHGAPGDDRLDARRSGRPGARERRTPRRPGAPDDAAGDGRRRAGDADRERRVPGRGRSARHRPRARRREGSTRRAAHSARRADGSTHGARGALDRGFADGAQEAPRPLPAGAALDAAGGAWSLGVLGTTPTGCSGESCVAVSYVGADGQPESHAFLAGTGAARSSPIWPGAWSSPAATSARRWSTSTDGVASERPWSVGVALAVEHWVVAPTTGFWRCGVGQRRIGDASAVERNAIAGIERVSASGRGPRPRCGRGLGSGRPADR
ncbi:MAG: hypothetical protein U1F43_26385 [Myxococcota bacterium]